MFKRELGGLALRCWNSGAHWLTVADAGPQKVEPRFSRLADQESREPQAVKLPRILRDRGEGHNDK